MESFPLSRGRYIMIGKNIFCYGATPSVFHLMNYRGDTNRKVQKMILGTFYSLTLIISLIIILLIPKIELLELVSEYLRMLEKFWNEVKTLAHILLAENCCSVFLKSHVLLLDLSTLEQVLIRSEYAVSISTILKNGRSSPLLTFFAPSCLIFGRTAYVKHSNLKIYSAYCMSKFYSGPLSQIKYPNK